MPITHLPSQPTSFVGRETELADIAARLSAPNCRLLTLVGSGGIGKTRLAIQAVTHQLPHFADGIIFVSLAPVGSPDLLASAIASALDITLYGSEVPIKQIITYLGVKHILLVMDNFEHLLDGANLLSELLQAPNVKILATSRERLNLQEEWVFALDGLSFPAESFADAPEGYGAVQLFVQRAQQVQVHFAFKQNAEAIVSICRQLDGMPLGLELAASWLHATSCQQIADQIASNLDFLTTPLRNIPERHRSLRAVFTHSWNLLSENEQCILMKLSVFRGGFDVEAASSVAEASLAELGALVNKSLIQLNPSGRYDLHELVRQYAADKLLDAGLAEVTIQQHIHYFLNLAEQGEAHLFSSYTIAWFKRLDVEFDNLRAAFTRSSETEIGLRLVTALSWFLIEYVHWAEARTWFELALAANPDAPVSLRAKALHTATAIANMLDESRQRARILGQEALTLARAANDRWNLAWALSQASGTLLYTTSDEIIAALEESLALFEALDDAMGMTHTLIRLSLNATTQQDYPYVHRLLEKAAMLANQAGDYITRGWIAKQVGLVCWKEEGNFKEAVTRVEHGLSIFREADYQIGINHCLIGLAQIEQECSNIKKAQVRYRQALLSFENSIPNHPYLPDMLVQFAHLAWAEGELKRAATLLGAANRTLFNSMYRPVQYIIDSDSDMTAFLTQLGEAAFEVAWAEGRAMTREQSIAYALEDGDRLTSISPTSEDANPLLTEREQEILHLTAEGLNSREVADRLILSVSTIRWYLKGIYGKLDAHSRAEAIARAKGLKLLV